MMRLALVVALLLALPASANKNLQTKQGAHLNTAGNSTVVFSFAASGDCSGSVTGVTTARTASGYCTKTDGTMTLLGAATTRSGVDGIMEEAAAQNVLLQSEAIDNAAYTKTNVTVPTTDSSAPMGSVAETVLATAGSVRHNIAQAYTATAVAWTCSAIVKKPVGSVDFAWLSINNGTNYTHFNLNTGAKATEGAGNTGAIEALSNGYYRIAVTRTMGAGATSVHLGLSNADAAATFNAAGTETLLATAMQCEIGSKASSYIPTLGTAVTRTVERSHNIPANTGALTVAGACMSGTLKNSLLATSSGSLLMNPLTILTTGANYFGAQFGVGGAATMQCILADGTGVAVSAPGTATGTTDTFSCTLTSTTLTACLNAACSAATAHGRDITLVTTPSIDMGWLRQLTTDRQPNGGLSAATFARSSTGCP